MPRINLEPTSPVARYFSFKNGKLGYYDKVNAVRVEVADDFTFLVLDQLSTVAGWSDHDESNYWGNEVRKTTEEPITVRTKNGVKGSGLYKELTMPGIKYARSVYVGFFDEDEELVIGNIKMSGAAVTAWFELSKSTNLYEVSVAITGTKEGSKGSVKYAVPVFGVGTISPETDDKAGVLQKKIGDYLGSRRTTEAVDEVASILDEGEELSSIDLSNLPF